MLKPIIVKSTNHYKIWIKFNDGVEGEVDLSHLKGKGVFQYWDNYENFRNVYIDEETNAVTWNNDLQLDNLNLYFKLVGKSFEEWQKEKQYE